MKQQIHLQTKMFDKFLPPLFRSKSSFHYFLFIFHFEKSSMCSRAECYKILSTELKLKNWSSIKILEFLTLTSGAWLNTRVYVQLPYVLHRCTISEQLLKPYLVCKEAKRQQEHHVNAASHHLAPSKVEAITLDMKGI